MEYDKNTIDPKERISAVVKEANDKRMAEYSSLSSIAQDEMLVGKDADELQKEHSLLGTIANVVGDGARWLADEINPMNIARDAILQPEYSTKKIGAVSRFGANVAINSLEDAMKFTADIEDSIRQSGINIPAFSLEEMRFKSSDEMLTERQENAYATGDATSDMNMGRIGNPTEIETMLDPIASYFLTSLFGGGPTKLVGTALAAGTIDLQEGNLSNVLADFGILPELAEYLGSRPENAEVGYERLNLRMRNLVEEGVLTAAFLALPITFKMLKNSGVQFTLGTTALTAIPEEAEAGIGGSVGELVDAGLRRIKGGQSKGQYVGAPVGIDSPQKLAALRRKVFNIAKGGEIGRFWYERSGQQILDAVGGDIDEADKLIQAIAVTSPGTPVKSNLDYAIQAYNQWKAGETIKTGRFPTAMSKKLEEIFSGKDWDGRKTDDFYNNLMIHIDPERAGPVTGDIWMLRSFGFIKPNEMPTEQQYAFITRETQRMAKALDWEPHQVQAAMWVNMKAKSENPELKKLVEKISEKKGWITYKTNEKGRKQRVVLNKEKHMENWFNQALKYEPTDADFERAKFDYADAIRANMAQISWESKPSFTSNHMPEIFEAPFEQQAEFHTAVSKGFLDEEGTDLLAKKIGIMSPGDFEAPGYFEGVVSPGTQTEVVVPRKYTSKGYGQVEPAALDLMSQYAAVRGVLLKQDGVGFHRPFYDPKKADANGFEIRIGRPLTPEETTELGKILEELSGHLEYNPIGRTDGGRIINFDHARKLEDGTPAQKDTWVPKELLRTNKEFISLVKTAIERLNLGDTGVEIKYFNSQNGYSANNWKESVNGEDHLRELGGEGLSDVYGKVYSIIEEFQPIIDDIEADFAERYGWSRNLELNAKYRTKTE